MMRNSDRVGRAGSLFEGKKATEGDPLFKCCSVGANPDKIRNVGIIGHVDAGKATLVRAMKARGDLLLYGEQPTKGKEYSALVAPFFPIVFSRENEASEVSLAHGTCKKSTKKGEGDQREAETFALGSERVTKYLVNLVCSFPSRQLQFPSAESLQRNTVRNMCVTDGCVVVVDVVEGFCMNTETSLADAVRMNIKPVLLINKVDRLFTQLQLEPEEIYLTLKRVIAWVNERIVAQLRKRGRRKKHKGHGTEEDLREDWILCPTKGTVIFGSAKYDWAFTIGHFAKLYAQKFGCSARKLAVRLWGNWTYDRSRRKFVSTLPVDYRSTGASSTGMSEPASTFCTFVVRPLYQLHNAVLQRGGGNPDTSRLSRILDTIGVHLTKEQMDMTFPSSSSSSGAKSTNSAAHSSYTGPLELLGIIMRRWLSSAGGAVIDAAVDHLPSPPEAQQYRALHLLQRLVDKGVNSRHKTKKSGERSIHKTRSDNEKNSAETKHKKEEEELKHKEERGEGGDEWTACMRTCDPEGPLIVYISSMVPTFSASSLLEEGGKEGTKVTTKPTHGCVHDSPGISSSAFAFPFPSPSVTFTSAGRKPIAAFGRVFGGTLRAGMRALVVSRSGQRLFFARDVVCLCPVQLLYCRDHGSSHSESAGVFSSSIALCDRITSADPGGGNGAHRTAGCSSDAPLESVCCQYLPRSIPAGNLVLLVGLEDAIDQSATLTRVPEAILKQLSVNTKHRSVSSSSSPFFRGLDLLGEACLPSGCSIPFVSMPQYCFLSPKVVYLVVRCEESSHTPLLVQALRHLRAVCARVEIRAVVPHLCYSTLGLRGTGGDQPTNFVLASEDPLLLVSHVERLRELLPPVLAPDGFTRANSAQLGHGEQEAQVQRWAASGFKWDKTKAPAIVVSQLRVDYRETLVERTREDIPCIVTAGKQEREPGNNDASSTNGVAHDGTEHVCLCCSGDSYLADSVTVASRATGCALSAEAQPMKHPTLMLLDSTALNSFRDEPKHTKRGKLCHVMAEEALQYGPYVSNCVLRDLGTNSANLWNLGLAGSPNLLVCEVPLFSDSANSAVTSPLMPGKTGGSNDNCAVPLRSPPENQDKCAGKVGHSAVSEEKQQRYLYHLKNMRGFITAGWRRVRRSGPLCGAPLRGVRMALTGAALPVTEEEENRMYSATGDPGHILPVAVRAFREALVRYLPTCTCTRGHQKLLSESKERQRHCPCRGHMSFKLVLVEPTARVVIRFFCFSSLLESDALLKEVKETLERLVKEQLEGFVYAYPEQELFCGHQLLSSNDLLRFCSSSFMKRSGDGTAAARRVCSVFAVVAVIPYRRSFELFGAVRTAAEETKKKTNNQREKGKEGEDLHFVVDVGFCFYGWKQVPGSLFDPGTTAHRLVSEERERKGMGPLLSRPGAEEAERQPREDATGLGRDDSEADMRPFGLDPPRDGSDHQLTGILYI